MGPGPCIGTSISRAGGPCLDYEQLMNRLFAGTQFDIPPQCDDCGKLQSECACAPQEKAAKEAARQREADLLPPEEQTARVNVQKRKGGRKVTVVEGLTSKANDLKALLASLQSACGTGGTVKGDTVELQGDQEQSICATLRQIGYRVK